MIWMNIKRLYRKKWLLIKMFLLSPIVGILPALLIGVQTGKLNQQILLHTCIWSFIYFAIFEYVNQSMGIYASEKSWDVYLSAWSLYMYQWTQKIAVLFAFVPSLLMNLLLTCLIFQIQISFFQLAILFCMSSVCLFLIMDTVLILEMRMVQYFQTFNFLMSFLYVVSGVLYPLSVLPKFLQIVAWFFPTTYLFQMQWKTPTHSLVSFLLLSIGWAMCLAFLYRWSLHQKMKVGERL